jgi:hypothetical protein
MNMKKTIVCLLAMAVVVLCQSLTACKDDSEPEHTHTWGAFGAPTPATATADSIATRTCATCGATDTQPVAGYRDKTITVTIGGVDFTAKVEGTLLLAEWNSIGSKIEDAINGAYTTATGPTKSRFSVFTGNAVVIVISKAGAKCKVNDGAFKTLNLRLDYLDNAGLQATITSAVVAMATESEGGYELAE